ncbi:MAG: bifunctional UDP-N-acetylglucosamine diphosphorylase/glucosamine-1-phosphate N-acetyltransferase GlmU [Alphaproteobacteria bacterium]
MTFSPSRQRRTDLAAVILAAGKGTRMKSALPKVLHPVAGLPMVHHVLGVARAAGASQTVVVLAKGMDAVAAAVAPARVAIQDPPLGTGHAVLAARAEVAGFSGRVAILFADTPLITPENIEAVEGAMDAAGAAIGVLGFTPPDPAMYGRLIRNADGSLERIVEFKDATAEERQVVFCNSGIMIVEGEHLFALLDQVGNANAQGEYYLTEIVAIARRQGLQVAAAEASPEDVMGVDHRVALSRAEAVMQRRLREKAMLDGVTLTDPDSVFLSMDTQLGRDVVVGPNVVFGPKVKVADNVQIRPFCHLEDCTIGDGALIGPYARLRPGAQIGRDVHIGNFVEVKKAVIEDGAKANHLAYIGDARVGARSNIGAGTITCNYDGFDKHVTDIGADVFIGSNTALVAPVKVGDGAMVGAGSVITRNVDANALAVERADQRQVDGYAEKFRARKRAAKKSKTKE